MRMRQEQVVFAGALVLLALVGWKRFDGAAPQVRGLGGAARAPELTRHGAPPLDAVRAREDLPRLAATGRSAFDPPSDTRPLPPLDFEEPPLPPLALLAPPPLPGPLPGFFAQTLRSPRRTFTAPGLFDEVEPDWADEASLAAETPAELAGAARAGLISPAEQLALNEGLKQIYDWIELVPGRPTFGHLRHPDRFGLALGRLPNDAIPFEEVDPATGAPRFRGQPPVRYERERVLAFGLAATLENELELGWASFTGNISPSTAPAALALAERALSAADGAPRALEIAEKLAGELIAHDPDAVEPRLLLARRHERAFELERAVGAYEDLIARFPHLAEPQVALARLEARLLLWEPAEARLREAMRSDRTGWAARWALGELLLSRGRAQEALALLEAAQRSAPQTPEERDLRLAIRLDLAAALLALGRISDALSEYEAAVRAVPDSAAALAGRKAAELLAGGADGAPASPAGLEDSAEPFTLLLARGLVSVEQALARRDAAEAERALGYLRRAAQSDPLNAHAAWRAISYLADRAGYGEEALAFADRALEVEPNDPWTLVHRGRLRVELGLDDGAEEDLRAALAREADFEDALAWAGELHWRRGRFAEAERYFARALEVASERSADRAALLERRALCLVYLDAFLEAREAAEAALRLDGDRAAARGALAWCLYRSGEEQEALIRLAALDEALRGEAESDPRRVWAKRQIERLEEHGRRVIWSDTFERTVLANQWFVEEAAGPRVGLEAGEVLLGGTFSRAGEARLWREYPGEQFVSLELDLYVDPESVARVGVFAAREIERAGRRQIQAQVAIARARDGAAQFRIVRQTAGEEAWIDLPGIDFPSGRWVRVRIEREGEGSATRVSVALDGIPVLEGQPLAGLARSAAEIKLGVFAEGDLGRPVRVRVDNVEVVRRLAR